MRRKEELEKVNARREKANCEYVAHYIVGHSFEAHCRASANLLHSFAA
jgi:hypothetical protein